MEVMTLAQRKAAKLSKLTSQDAKEPGPSIQNVTVDEAIKMVSEPTMPVQAASAQATSAQAPSTQTVSAPTVKAESTPEKMSQAQTGSLTAAQILELAAKHGLKLQAPKKEYVKHTYSVTVDSKALFKKYCDVLGFSMQDAMEEAMQDFFKKHALEYTRVKQAKSV